MSFQDFVLNRQQGHDNINQKQHKSKGYIAWLAMNGRARNKAIVDNENEGEPARIVPKSQRGVRPRLETKCPVTSRKLLTEMDDNMSVQSLQSQQSRLAASRSHHEDDPQIPTVQRSTNASQRQSIYAHLTKEIVNFQKMVAELESLTEVSGVSPESQWRTRILIRSAQDADRDIWKRLYEYESSHGENPNYSRAQMASRKLHRDFQRVHKQLKSIMVSYEKRQQVEIAFLSSARQPQGEEKKEDFFDRVMREREEEVDNIQKSMQKVNEIYSDLAILVDGQQEKIDQIADKNEDSKARTKSGLEQIHQAAFGLCAPLNRSMNDWTTSDESKRNSSSNSNIGSSSQSASASAKLKRGDLRVEEEFKWTMPFETIGDDMQAVREDVFRLIEDFSIDGDNNPMGAAISCAPLSFGNFKPTRGGCGIHTSSQQQPPKFHHQYIIDDTAIEIPIQYRSSSMKHRRI